MSALHYQQQELYIENVSLKQIAEKYGTPTYIYSKAILEANWRQFDEAFKDTPHRICYAVKANSNIAILNVLAKLNAGFDIVSLGELERVIAARGDLSRVVFSGVGKKREEMIAAIKQGIDCFNVESEAELSRLNQIAATLHVNVNVALRINPNIDPDTHAYISTGLNENKFGIEPVQALALCQQWAAYPFLKLCGIATHLGSQVTTLSPFLLALDYLLQMAEQLKAMGFSLQHINIGGGLGIRYGDEPVPTIQEYAQALQKKLTGSNLQLILEPGRAIVGNAGVLVTRIEYLKTTSTKNFAITDAGMNDLLRPALYQAWQAILPVSIKEESDKKRYDIVGPVCESADFLGKDRELALAAEDLLAIDCAGAYGFCMSSNYNTRGRAAEVLVDGDHALLIRHRETMQALFAAEIIP